MQLVSLLGLAEGFDDLVLPLADVGDAKLV